MMDFSSESLMGSFCFSDVFFSFIFPPFFHNKLVWTAGFYAVNLYLFSFCWFMSIWLISWSHLLFQTWRIPLPLFEWLFGWLFFWYFFCQNFICRWQQNSSINCLEQNQKVGKVRFRVLMYTVKVCVFWEGDGISPWRRPLKI